MKRIIKSILRKTGLETFAFKIYELVRAYDPRMLARNKHIRPVDGLPLPPAHLMILVAGSADGHWFLEIGRRGAQAIRDILTKNSIELSQFKSILDFGCGSGRVIRHWHDVKNTEIHGTDYNPVLVDWCQNNLKFASFEINKLTPPLTYPDNKFDFVYALSVFTHMPEDLQMAWIKELSRILAPNGYLLITTHGESYLSRLNTQEQSLFNQGELVVRSEQAQGTNLCNAYHPERYIREKLAKDFNVVDFIPQGAKGNPHQDIYLLHKK